MTSFALGLGLKRRLRVTQKWANGVGLTSHWLRKWRDMFLPITNQYKTKAIAKLLSTIN